MSHRVSRTPNLESQRWKGLHRDLNERPAQSRMLSPSSPFGVSARQKGYGGFTAAYLCKALEIGDRRAVSRTWDRAGAMHE